MCTNFVLPGPDVSDASIFVWALKRQNVRSALISFTCNQENFTHATLDFELYFISTGLAQVGVMPSRQNRAAR